MAPRQLQGKSSKIKENIARKKKKKNPTSLVSGCKPVDVVSLCEQQGWSHSRFRYSSSQVQMFVVNHKLSWSRSGHARVCEMAVVQRNAGGWGCKFTVADAGSDHRILSGPLGIRWESSSQVRHRSSSTVFLFLRGEEMCGRRLSTTTHNHGEHYRISLLLIHFLGPSLS